MNASSTASNTWTYTCWSNNMYYTYVVKCSDGSLYCGVASDVRRRIREHYLRLPRAAKYTKSHQVTGVAAVWESDDKVSAMKLEYRFKTLPKSQKLLLAENRDSIDSYIKGLEGCSFRPVSVSLSDCVSL